MKTGVRTISAPFRHNFKQASTDSQGGKTTLTQCYLARPGVQSRLKRRFSPAPRSPARLHRPARDTEPRIHVPCTCARAPDRGTERYRRIGSPARITDHVAARTGICQEFMCIGKTLQALLARQQLAVGEGLMVVLTLGAREESLIARSCEPAQPCKCQTRSRRMGDALTN
jgi:hypothetical protein